MRLNAVLTQLHRHCLLFRHTVNHSNAEEAHVKVAEHLSLLKQVQTLTECGSEVGTPIVYKTARPFTGGKGAVQIGKSNNFLKRSPHCHIELPCLQAF